MPKRINTGSFDCIKLSQADVHYFENSFKEKDCIDLHLEYASFKIRNNKSMVLKSIRLRASELKYASPKLKNNRDIILEAVRKSGKSLKYASENLKNDREIVIE